VGLLKVLKTIVVMEKEMNKIHVFLILGIIFVILSIEQAMANSNQWHITLAPWLWAILFLVGIYLIGKAWDERKKQKTKR